MNNRFYVLDRLRSAWNVFLDRDPKEELEYHGPGYSIPQHRKRFGYGNERSIVSAVYNRCALDVSSIKLRHVRVDDNGTYLETIESSLNRCLSMEANIDQTHRAFIQDIVMSLFDEGTVAIVPTDTSVSLTKQNSFDILTLRTARIVQWYPHRVRVSVYNDNTGKKEEITLEKSKVGIIENPLYAVMNERNSTLQRLIAKLNLLDAIDEQSGSGKLDLIIQLPYVIKTEARKLQAETRRKDLEEQLRGSKYGIAYADGTEKVIQLNRAAENNLMEQIEFLTRTLYSQLGMSEKIFDGTADEKELLNYYNRTIEPLASAIADEFKRKFLTKTAQSQGQSIMHFRNVFSLVTAETLAELSDKLTRNEILSSNEVRAVMGYTPSKDPAADELRNKNLNQDKPIDVTQEFDGVTKEKAAKEKIQNGSN